MKTSPANTARVVAAGFLTWLLPGLGHWYLGHRKLAIVLCVAITLPYLTGVAVGGVKTSVNPHLNRWLFLAETGTGGLTGAFYALNNVVGGIDVHETSEIIQRGRSFKQQPIERQHELEAQLGPMISYYPSSDIAQIYLAVAGLLNLLAILDAMTRAQTGGLPVYYHELKPESAAGGGGA